MVDRIKSPAIHIDCRLYPRIYAQEGDGGRTSKAVAHGPNAREVHAGRAPGKTIQSAGLVHQAKLVQDEFVIRNPDPKLLRPGCLHTRG